MISISELYTIYKQFPSVETDTRKLKQGDLFFALKGDNFNGNKFASQAITLGASYAIVDEYFEENNEKIIVVENVLETLQQLAYYHRKQFTIPFLAITGSNGKTTTKELIHAVLSTKYKTYATSGNLNNHIGIPLTILQIKTDAEFAIIEMGANHANEIAQYCTYAEPTHALITNCGKAHLEGFGSIEGVQKAKGELYDFIRDSKGTIFRNSDYDYLKLMSVGIQHQITYGSANAMIIGKPITQNDFLHLAILTHLHEQTISSQLVGIYNFPNILAAVAVGISFHISDEDIKHAIETYLPTNSRSQLIKRGTNTVILDAYNANPSSMKVAIENMQTHEGEKKILMLGAMMELGENSKQEHQEIVNQIMQTKWTQVILVGGDFEYVNHPFLFFKNTDEARQWYLNNEYQNTIFLVKGSRAIAMEKVIEA